MSIQRTIRSGVIPYTVQNDTIHFLFGRDKKSGDLCDFGGGRKKDESSHDAAIREFKEESNCIFGDYKRSDLSDAVGLLCRRRKNMIFFLPVGTQWLESAPGAFEARNRQYPNKEIAQVKWIDESLYTSLIYEKNNNGFQSERIWEKLRFFLFKHSNDRNRFFSTLKDKFETGMTRNTI